MEDKKQACGDWKQLLCPDGALPPPYQHASLEKKQAYLKRKKKKPTRLWYTKNICTHLCCCLQVFTRCPLSVKGAVFYWKWFGVNLEQFSPSDMLTGAGLSNQSIKTCDTSGVHKKTYACKQYIGCLQWLRTQTGCSLNILALLPNSFLQLMLCVSKQHNCLFCC